MEALDELIRKEERKIDNLTNLRYQPDAFPAPSTSSDSSGNDDHDYCDFPKKEDVDYCIEKAYEHLSILKIRRYLGY
jgi:hypothetical protein